MHWPLWPAPLPPFVGGCGLATAGAARASVAKPATTAYLMRIEFPLHLRVGASVRRVRPAGNAPAEPNVSTSGEMRLLNQIHGGGTKRIRSQFPDVDVVEVPVDGDVDPSVEGDALVAIPFASSVKVLAATLFM